MEAHEVDELTPLVVGEVANGRPLGPAVELMLRCHRSGGDVGEKAVASIEAAMFASGRLEELFGHPRWKWWLDNTQLGKVLILYGALRRMGTAAAAAQKNTNPPDEEAADDDAEDVYGEFDYEATVETLMYTAFAKGSSESGATRRIIEFLRNDLAPHVARVGNLGDLQQRYSIAELLVAGPEFFEKARGHAAAYSKKRARVENDDPPEGC